MTLADHVETTTPLGQVELGAEGGTFEGLRSDEPIKDWDDALRRLGVDPEFFMVATETVRVSSWQQSKRLENGDRDTVTLYAYSGHITARRDRVDLPALYAEVRRTKHRPLKTAHDDTTAVIVWADMQLGKLGSRGGTPELLARMQEKRVALETWLKKSAPQRCVFIDAGDAIEGFENTAQQMFTNDLSAPQQVDVAAVEMWKTLTLLARFAPVDAVAVPSNHGAWRNGKQQLGKPSDDWGIAIQSRLKFQAELVGLPITFHKPADWDESVAIDIQGTTLGVHHGHQSSCDTMPKWWAGQVHGGQALAAADIFVSGHYHHLRIQPTGRNPRTGKSKWWIQAPTLDNGSDWFRNKSGDDSDPGLLVFRVDDNGFNLQSLSVL